MSLRNPKNKKPRQARSSGRPVTDSDQIFMLEDKTITEDELPDGEEDLPEPEVPDDSEEDLPEPEVPDDSEEDLPEPEVTDDSEEDLPNPPSEKEEERDRYAAPHKEKNGGEEEIRDDRKAAAAAERSKRGDFRRGTGKKKGTLVLTGIILDGTISFTSVFPAVYYALEEFMTHMRAQSKEYNGITFRYGLTILHNNAESVMFPGETFFTGDENLIRKAINNMEFHGGSEDGRENLDGALREQLLRQNEYDPEEFETVYRGVILFSDSVSDGQEEQADFSTAYLDADQKIVNHGVRFAQSYTFDGEYLPAMRMVDRKGKQTDNEKNIAAAIDIHELINGGEKAVTDEVKNIVSAILSQTSVGS